MQAPQDQVPQKFNKFLDKLAEQTKISIKFVGQSSDQLHKVWNSKKNNVESLPPQKLAEIGISDPDDMNRFIQSWTSSKKLSKKIRYKINKNKKVEQQDFPLLEQVVLDFLIQKSHLNNSEIMKDLQESFGINLASTETFFSNLNKLVEVQDQNHFKDESTKIIIQQCQDFQYISEQDQSSIIEILFKRNSAYQNLKPFLEHLEYDDCFELANYVFSEEECQQIENPEIQTKEQFTNRVKAFIFGHCRILRNKDINDKTFGPRVENAASNLFEQRQKKNLFAIKQTLKQSNFVEFRQPQKIPDNVILQIFQLKSIEEFAKFQKVEQPKPVQKPVSKILKEEPAKKSEIKVVGMGKYKNELDEEMESEQDFGSDLENGIMNRSAVKRGKKCYSTQQDQLSAKESKSNKSAKSTNQKSDSMSADSSQKLGQIFQAEMNRIKAIQKELQLIKKKTGNTECLESVLRQLEISVLEDRTQKMEKNCEKIVQMINLYGQSQSYISLVKEIPASYLNKGQRKPLVRDLRRKLQHLNLEDIIISKQNIQSVALKCKDAFAVIEVGLSGVGKTTTLHGMSGHQLVYSQKTKDYRCSDPKLAAQYKIGDTITSETTECNNSKIPKKWTEASGYEQVKTIDTPGLKDNRDAETACHFLTLEH